MYTIQGCITGVVISYGSVLQTLYWFIPVSWHKLMILKMNFFRPTVLFTYIVILKHSISPEPVSRKFVNFQGSEKICKSSDSTLCKVCMVQYHRETDKKNPNLKYETRNHQIIS